MWLQKLQHIFALLRDIRGQNYRVKFHVEESDEQDSEYEGERTKIQFLHVQSVLDSALKALLSWV